MDMYQKRKMRKEKAKNNTVEESVKKTNINWDRQIYVPIAANPYK